MLNECGESGRLLACLWGCRCLLDALELLAVAELAVPHATRSKEKSSTTVLLAVTVLALVLAAVGKENLTVAVKGVAASGSKV
jgi:hypothetical protein